MWSTLPELGFVTLCAVIVTAAFTLAVALGSTSRGARWLGSARYGAYGTIALVGFAVLLLAYAFVANDFRVRYVAHYSDRSMSPALLLGALWGGQDGSLLWWLFLTSAFSGLAIASLKSRLRELQPALIATLMVVLVFLAIVMLFAVNPFATSATGAPPDGRGLNYQLRNFYMIVHPPSLYLGFTCSVVPFALVVAALVTGRLGNEWLVTSRRWLLVAWIFLTLGNGLGMLWAYEELGWGGYWSWDPVENASLLPWLSATAGLHSMAMQERRPSFKRWNVFWVCATFWLTLFGTFLTRSGLISSVHAFARSSIGTYFLWFMALVGGGSAALGWLRRRELRPEHQSRSWLSREGVFVAQNLVQLALVSFVLVATLWPRIAEWLYETPATVGPDFYNTFVPPIALVLLVLMGLAPLVGWRRSPRELLWRGLRWPLAVALVVAAAHAVLGRRLGMPPFVTVAPALPSALGRAAAWLVGKLPIVTVALVAFNVTVAGQELARGLQARGNRGAERSLGALWGRLVRPRRRHGGMIVHVGIALMMLGFVGRSWGTLHEATLHEGESVTVGGYTLRHVGVRRESDAEKRMIFVDLEVARQGRPLGVLSPARFIYDASPAQPSTEVGKLVRMREDLYAIAGMLTADGTAGVQIHVNPLVSLVWLGIAVAALGGLFAAWPALRRRSRHRFGYVRAHPALPGGPP